ncbi:MAG: hypothetical protein MK101_05100 [Phycisphaerales bacterium]|nr:hypothetical protein [Phycisphaerales bacterium]
MTALLLQLGTQAVPAAAGAAQAAATGNETALFWGFILIGAALVVLAMELLLPTGGLLALVSGALLVGALVAFFNYSTGAGYLALVLMLVLGPLGLWYGFKFWSTTRMARRFVLEVEGPASQAAQSLEGCHGVAETPLRPIGTVRVQGQRRDALSELGVIEAGTGVVVVEDRDNQLKVRAAQPHEEEGS